MKKYFLRLLQSIAAGRLVFAALLLLGVTGPALHRAHGQGPGALMPYTRYESENGTRGGGAALQQSPQFDQNDIASEASNQQYVSLSANGSYVEWTLAEAMQGVNLRFTLPDDATGAGQHGKLGLYVNEVKVQDIALSSYWAYQYFHGLPPEPVQTPGGRTFMRFDEVHFLLPASVPAGAVIRIAKDHGDGLTYGVDFLELETVLPPLLLPPNFLSVTAYGAVAGDQGDDLAAFKECLRIAALQDKDVYIPAGEFWLSNRLDLTVTGMKIQGAGIWHTRLYFSNNLQHSGGIMGKGADNVEIAHLSLNTINNRRIRAHQNEYHNPDSPYMDYKGFMGTYGNGSHIHDVWVEHFECGFWIGDYELPLEVTNGLRISQARIRNNYADGVNFCQGTSNSTVTQSSIRNSGDDALAVWPNNHLGAPAARNNTFAFNTIENNWRAGGVALFGGTGHQVRNNVIKDGVAGSGIRLNTEFPGHTFEPNGTPIAISGNRIIACGTSTDHWGDQRGAFEFFTGHGNYNGGRGIYGVQLDNNEIVNAQRHAIRFDGENIRNIVFNHTRIDGTGRDAVPYDKEGGFGIKANAQNGSATFNNISFSRIESDSVKNDLNTFIININNTNVPLTGLALSPASRSLAAGETAPLTVTYSPAGATNKTLTWTSSNPAVATVAATGTGTATVTANAAGSAVVTVRSADGGFTQTCTLTVTAANNPPCTAPAIVFTATAPVFGPTLDAAWHNAPAGTLDKVVLGTFPSDFAGSRWRALYDNANLYVLVEVKDNVKRHDSGTTWWEDDAVELFIDGNNSKSSTFDGVDDFQFVFRYNDPAFYLGGNSVNRRTGVQFAMQDVTGGYNLEVRIPWSTLGVSPAAGNPIGFELEVNDDDDGGNRDAQVAFASTVGVYQNPSLFGTVVLTTCGGTAAPAPVINSSLTAGGSVGTGFRYTLTAANGPTGFDATGLPAGLGVDKATGVISGTPTQPGTRNVILTATNAGGTDTKTLVLTVGEPAGVVTCYAAPGAIVVDGSLGETGWNPGKPVAKNAIGTGNNTVTFGALWNNTHLYVGVKVLDGNLFSDSPDAWEDDAIEVFMDANNNQSAGYDGADSQIIKNYNKSTVFTKLPMNGLQHAWAAIPGGYSIELAIPWSQLGIPAPANGTTIGFDVACNDDDDRGGRETQVVWHGTGDNYLTTAAFGKLVLSSAQPGARQAAGPVESPAVALLPNPVTRGQLQIWVPAAAGGMDVQVLDLQGRAVLRKHAAGNRITLPVAHLAKGLYLAVVHTQGKTVTRKFVIE